MRVPHLLGRVLFGGYFIASGVNHFRHTGELAQYAAAKRVPKADLAVQLTGAALIAGGASILLGVKPRLGTAAIVGFLAGVTPVMHDFWKEENPELRMNSMVNFTKNIALIGGAMSLMGVEEPWSPSVMTQPTARQRAKRILRESLAA
jgi:putative oxidoreductase